jgi:hypothetical protein
MNQSNTMSLYIPHVFGNVTKEYMMETIEFQGLGKVKHIDFVEKMGKNGKTYNSAFVHFDFWNDNITVTHFQERVKDLNKEARIVYNDPWFWVCFENKGKKHTPGERKERINLNDLYDNNSISNVFEFEEEKNEVNAINLPQELEDQFERELLEEFGCNDNNVFDYVNCSSLISYTKKKEIDMEYVRQLEMLNYKLIHDLYELRGDFISTF